ncbi:MAG: LuxR family transcriptional regulator [Gemmatimonadetes bacterium]|nr:MAG: LuxR family transcriptional regulator [Gemmatimonadota bacterium]
MGSTLQMLSDNLAAAAERVGQRVVAIKARRRIPSSGILWRDGIVVTAQHTIQREEDIVITLADGMTSPADLVGRDPGTDLAALRLAKANGGPIDVAPLEALRVGSLVLALGRPGRELTAAFGLVSAVGDAWRTWHGGRIDRLIRLDIGIYDGFSGGPLVDADGRVLGVNTSTLLRGVPTAVPAATVDRVLAQLLEHGHVPTGYLGVGMQSVRLPEQLARSLEPSRNIGLMVVSVDPDGPAGRGGVLLGDVITAIDDQAVSEPADMLAQLDAARVGKAARLGLVRAGQLASVTVTVGQRPGGNRR